MEMDYVSMEGMETVGEQRERLSREQGHAERKRQIYQDTIRQTLSSVAAQAAVDAYVRSLHTSDPPLATGVAAADENRQRAQQRAASQQSQQRQQSTREEVIADTDMYLFGRSI